MITESAAQRIASYWISPQSPAITELAQRGHVRPGLKAEIAQELQAVAVQPGHYASNAEDELLALYAYAREVLS